MVKEQSKNSLEIAAAAQSSPGSHSTAPRGTAPAAAQHRPTGPRPSRGRRRRWLRRRAQAPRCSRTGARGGPGEAPAEATARQGRLGERDARGVLRRVHSEASVEPEDVKGRNVLLGRGEAAGGAKLADFGVARQLSEVAPPPPAGPGRHVFEALWRGTGGRSQEPPRGATEGAATEPPAARHPLTG